jgi:MoxR-like ATPase
VRSKVDELTETLEISRVVVIHGPTGSGKTEIAQLVGKRITGKEPLIIYGHRDVSAREFRGHDILTRSNRIPLLDIPTELEHLKAQYREAHPKMNPTKFSSAYRLIEAKFLRDNNVTVSDFALGYLYQSARDGNALIIDEFNLIPGSVLKGLYSIMTKKPGELIHVPENDHPPFPVHKDFCILMTGNINTGAHTTYLDRERPDASDKNRARFVSYDFLPQTTEGSARDAHPEEKQLYEVILSTLRDGPMRRESSDLGSRVEDRAITAVLPGGAESLHALWRLAKLAAITQLALQGKATGDSPYAHRMAGVAQAAEVEHALSPRVVVRILESWKKSFEYELDHYIFRELVYGALSDSEKDYFYRQMLMQGFCQSPGWPAIDERRAKDGYLYNNVRSPHNKEAREPMAVPGRTLVREIYGDPPERRVWPTELPEAAKIKLNQERASLILQATELEAELEDLLRDYNFLK